MLNIFKFIIILSYIIFFVGCSNINEEILKNRDLITKHDTKQSKINSENEKKLKLIESQNNSLHLKTREKIQNDFIKLRYRLKHQNDLVVKLSQLVSSMQEENSKKNINNKIDNLKNELTNIILLCDEQDSRIDEYLSYSEKITKNELLNLEINIKQINTKYTHLIKSFNEINKEDSFLIYKSKDITGFYTELLVFNKRVKKLLDKYVGFEKQNSKKEKRDISKIIINNFNGNLNNPTFYQSLSHLSMIHNIIIAIGEENYDKLPEKIKQILFFMSNEFYKLDKTKNTLIEYEKMKKAIDNKNYDEAIVQMKDSSWFKNLKDEKKAKFNKLVLEYEKENN